MTSDPQHLPKPFRVVWVAIFLAAAFLVAAAGYIQFQAGTGSVIAERSQDLVAVGSLKARQLVEWRKERLADAIRFAQGPALVEPTIAFLRKPDAPGSREASLHMLSLNRKRDFYESALLVSSDEKVLLATESEPSPLTPATRTAIRKALALRQPVLSGIFRSADRKAHIDTAAPICDQDGQPLAAIILRADASSLIQPLIQFWPTESATAETLLIEREGDDVVFLSEAKPRPESASISPRIPLTQTRLVEVRAALGETGTLRGPDYRGKEVLADVRVIPSSDWRLITKVDRSEIMAEVRSREGNIVWYVGLSILLAAALTAVGYRRRQFELYRNLYRIEKEQRTAQQKFRTILYSIGDAVIVTDDEGRVRQMNPVAEHLTGWAEEEAAGQPLDEVFHVINEETRARVESPVWHVLKEGKIVGLANHKIGRAHV